MNNLVMNICEHIVPVFLKQALTYKFDPIILEVIIKAL